MAGTAGRHAAGERRDLGAERAQGHVAHDSELDARLEARLIAVAESLDLLGATAGSVHHARHDAIREGLGRAVRGPCAIRDRGHRARAVDLAQVDFGHGSPKCREDAAAKYCDLLATAVDVLRTWVDEVLRPALAPREPGSPAHWRLEWPP